MVAENREIVAKLVRVWISDPGVLTGGRKVRGVIGHKRHRRHKVPHAKGAKARGPLISGSRQDIRDELIETLAASHGLQCRFLVQVSGDPDYEFSAEFLAGGRLGQGFPVDQQDLDPLFDDGLKLRKNLAFIGAMAAVSDDGRGTADVTAVFLAPLDHFEIMA